MENFIYLTESFNTAIDKFMMDLHDYVELRMRGCPWSEF